jgi:hypothetical protein
MTSMGGAAGAGEASAAGASEGAGVGESDGREAGELRPALAADERRDVLAELRPGRGRREDAHVAR